MEMLNVPLTNVPYANFSINMALLRQRQIIFFSLNMDVVLPLKIATPPPPQDMYIFYIRIFS